MEYSLDDILECERTPRIYRKTRRDRMEELQNGTELHLTERQVKERLKLKDQPEDVRTISLPGSYHDKITHLDSSLLNFTRLVKLDLSRNALLSLDGLSHLKNLEHLNIYYNNIQTIDELYRLRKNQSLKDIDLRLNPVTKNEPDYRLFLVRILENLGRLDDRPVRENERSTAELHFDQNKKWESYRFGHLPSNNKPPSGAEKKSGGYKNARADYIKSDYVKAGLHNHERLYDEVEDVRTLLDGLGEAIGEKNTRINRHPRSSSYGDPLNRSISQSNQNLSFSSKLEKENDSCFIVEPNKGSFGESNFRLSDGIDQSDGLTTEDETHANTEYRSLAHFTRAPPGEWSNAKTIPTSVPRESRTRDRRLSSSTVASITDTTEASSEQLKPVLDLIDLYYTGQKSLAKSPAFMNKFCRLLSELRPSNDEIRNQLVDREIELRASSNSEKEKLKKQLEISETENKRLRNESHSLKHEVSVLSNGSGMNSLNSTCNEELVSMLKDSHEMIKRQNKKLESELDKIKQKYENDLSQMRSSQAQLKSLILKNSF